MNEYKFTDKNKKQCGYMRIVDEADTDSAELYFYGDICGSQWETYFEDKAPQDVADFLHSLDGKKKAVSEQLFRKRSVIFFTSIYSNQHQVPYLSVPLLSGVGVQMFRNKEYRLNRWAFQ